jgi:hypothetical protein
MRTQPVLCLQAPPSPQSSIRRKRFQASGPTPSFHAVPLPLLLLFGGSPYCLFSIPDSRDLCPPPRLLCAMMLPTACGGCREAELQLAMQDEAAKEAAAFQVRCASVWEHQSCVLALLPVHVRTRTCGWGVPVSVCCFATACLHVSYLRLEQRGCVSALFHTHAGSSCLPRCIRRGLFSEKVPQRWLGSGNIWRQPNSRCAHSSEVHPTCATPTTAYVTTASVPSWRCQQVQPAESLCVRACVWRGRGGGAPGPLPPLCL